MWKTITPMIALTAVMMNFNALYRRECH